MLVLSRKDGEQIQIGGDIVVTIIEIRGGRVSIGIEAPREVPVRRVQGTTESDQDADNNAGGQVIAMVS